MLIHKKIGKISKGTIEFYYIDPASKFKTKGFNINTKIKNRGNLVNKPKLQ